MRSEGESATSFNGSCNIGFEFKEELKLPQVSSGFPVFCSRILVRGYPVLRRAVPNSIFDILGLEDGGDASPVNHIEEESRQVSIDSHSKEINQMKGCLSSGLRSLRLIPYNSSHSLSTFSEWRIRLEDYLGCGEVDWYPLPPIDRLPSATQAKLAWTVSLYQNVKKLTVQ